MKKILKNCLGLFSVATILGCSVHSIDQMPPPSIETSEIFSLKGGSNEFQLAWWKMFDRPLLNQLVQSSLEKNWQIAEAIAVLEQAEALAFQTGTQKLPLISLTGSGSKDYGSGFSFSNDSEFGGVLTWELDVWKRISNAAKADRLEAQARVSDIDAIKLSLSAEVTQAMFGAVASNEQIKLLESQLKLDKELERILQLRSDEGIGNNLDLLQQQARVADSQTLIPVAESSRAVFENRLDVLLGEVPDGKNRVPTTENLQFSTELPVIGVPSSLLLNRADLVAARHELVAADADIGVAIADRLPSLRLTGSSEFRSGNDFSSLASLLTASFIHPLLDWGQRKAEVRRNKAVYQEQLAAFTQLYLEAVEDVENALIQEVKQREFLNRLDYQRSILVRAVKAAELRYQQGIDDYQPVINALQELRVIERNLVTEQLELLNIRVDLFRAIGGPLYDA